MVKKEAERERILIPGQGNYERCDNKVVSARYTPWTFVFVATVEQFRRFANMYFLVIGIIMAIGWYSTLFESAISPWTTLGPLAVVISFSLLVEGNADYKRHKNDEETNNAPCVILRRAEEIDAEPGSERDSTIIKGKDVVVNLNKAYYAKTTMSAQPSSVGEEANNVKVGFQKVRRMDIRQGHFVVVKNREMVPADMVLLASSNDKGSAYIETSSIDGETNLKLRNSPHLPRTVLKQLRDGAMSPIKESPKEENEEKIHEFESIEAATKRLTRLSALGRPGGQSVLEHPNYEGVTEQHQEETGGHHKRASSRFSFLKDGIDAIRAPASTQNFAVNVVDDGRYVAALTTEPPNPSVHTFSGKLTFPPFEGDGKCFDIPLGAENVLLRGAVIRNTEWVIGIAFFTGTDTKLIQNSFETPSKFSQLDNLMNNIVLFILSIMVLCIVYLASSAVAANDDSFDDLFYAGFNRDRSEPWPYLPEGFEPPKWDTEANNWLQFFFLYVTLLNNFIPLSLYVTVEFITFCMLWLVYVDEDMYDDTTNTRAVARSTIVTDLGRIQYIFSDKTGTLTQNVMRFKRCSVDGMAFGAPIQKSRPDAEEEQIPFHPLRKLLVGRFNQSGMEGLGEISADDKLTFNAEMFLRCMSLCHTVVVEKDLDKKAGIDSSMSTASSKSGKGSMMKSLFRKNRANTAESVKSVVSQLSAVSENAPMDESERASLSGREGRDRTFSTNSYAPGQARPTMGPDGAPYGFAYQAESPDEGALVSAASNTYGFRVVSRDSSGIRIKTRCPSHLSDERIVNGLKNSSLSLAKIAAETTSPLSEAGSKSDGPAPTDMGEEVEETWTILAVNKFDSDRKRMSILLRSPPNLGSLPILFCKGADSAMLDVCVGSDLLQPSQSDETDFQSPKRPSAIHAEARDVSALTTLGEGDENEDVDEWTLAQMLGLQAHLGDFASEGLRTLVLGMRVLTEKECEEWLGVWKAASVSLKNREVMLSEAATEIERDIHVVGATAIEDKLQVKVPETISTLGKAGIKLWVLTGDKRETAIEIGYSTHVLTPKMHVTEVSDQGPEHVKTQMAMEFMRMVKKGILPDYQKAVIGTDNRKRLRDYIYDIKFALGKCTRAIHRSITRCWIAFLKLIRLEDRAEMKEEVLHRREEIEKNTLKDKIQRERVRNRADSIIKEWLDKYQPERASRKFHSPIKGRKSEESEDELSLATEETPRVFNRASSAKAMLSDLRSSGRLSKAELRTMSIAFSTAQGGEEGPLVDEDLLSLESFFPDDKAGLGNSYDKKRRTVLERLFAIDKDVRKGRLRKHLNKELRQQLKQRDAGALSELHESTRSQDLAEQETGPRALVIEGKALNYLLGDHEMEQILFAVASKCDAVIACRSSPKQKALLVNLVRKNVNPEPITLAIGDGANDVGMIQEAHVGVGISGKEGKQAVNASDFAIAQFRFLQDLILTHGRWNFMRLSTVVLFSFYKNAIMAGTLIIFTSRTVYSGTPLYDEWLIAVLNFVAGIPIIILGLFDRCLSKDYVRRNPEVYKATRENELMTPRTLLRWILMVLIHLNTLYFFTVPAQTFGGGVTSAFKGLMRNDDRNAPGDGEGGDIKTVGTVTFTIMVIMLAYKVLYESRTLIHGKWPSFTCRKDAGENAWSRFAYTWIGVTWCSIGFYLGGIGLYMLLGRYGTSSFSRFVDTPAHALGMRSMSWMLIAFVPVVAMGFDVIGKTFSNMFYPTQTQIHMEIESNEISKSRMGPLRRMASRDRVENV